ncbi:uncharacterized protein [Littorina saxatilis]|uniref:C2H2-type domain-containing protein n=1 Tax=Littorina saxatilis TaxID=31220 RepID=A0AAN9BI59_9CAEN
MSWKVGLRIVDLGELARQMYCTDCSSILDLNSTESEVEVGLASVLKILCQCGRDNHVRTGTLIPQAQRASSFSTQVTQTSADDLMSFAINAKVYAEMLAYQRGEKTVLHFLAVLNIPASLLTTAHRFHHSEPLLWHQAQGDTTTSDASSATVVKHNTMLPGSPTLSPDPSVSTTVVKHNTMQPGSLTLSPDPSVSASASQDGSPSRKRRRKVTCDENIQSVKNPKSGDFTDEPVECSLHILATSATVRDVKDDFNLAGLPKSEQVDKVESCVEGAVFVSTTGQADLNIEESVCTKCETGNVCVNNGADTPPVASEVVSLPTHRRTRSSRLCSLQNQQSADNSRTKKNSTGRKKKAVDINKSTDETQDASRDSSTSSPKRRTSSDRNSLTSRGQSASHGQQTVKSTADQQGSSGQEETDRSVPAVTSVTSSRQRSNKKQKSPGNCERESARDCVGRHQRSRGRKKTAGKPRSLRTESRLQCGICEKLVDSPRVLAAHMSTAHADSLSRKGKTAQERNAEMGVNRKDTRPQSEEAGTDPCIADHGQPQLDHQECGASNNTQLPVSRTNQAGPPSVTKTRSRAMAAQNMQKAAYHCSQCNALFQSSREYTGHMRQRHSVTHPHQCGRCAQSFPTQHQLKRHRRQHSAVEEHHECTVCLKIFPTGRRLRAHRTTHTKQERFQPLKRYRCQVCGEEFAKNYFLQIHLNHHRGKKPYQCFLCEEAFFSKPERRAHYKKCVAKTQSYLCELCGGRFGSVSSLRKHERVHSGEKPHRCRFCDKTFSRTNTLQIHERQHTGETPYVCDQCGCGFKQRVSLVTHMKSKHSVIATYYSQPRTGPRFTHLDYLSGKAFTCNSQPDSTSSDNVNSSSDGDPAANLTQSDGDPAANLTQNRADALQAFSDAGMTIPTVCKSLLMSDTEDQTTAMTYSNVEGSVELTDHTVSSLIPYVVSGHGSEDGMATLAHAATVVALATNHTHTPVCPQGFHTMPHPALAPAEYSALASTQQSVLASTQHTALTSVQHAPLASTQHTALASTQHTALTSVQHAPLASTQHTALASAQHTALTSVQHASLASTQHTALTSTQHTALTSVQHAPLASTQQTALASTHQSVLGSVQHGPLAPTQHTALASVEHAAIATTQHPALACVEHAAITSTQCSMLTSTVHSADDISAGFTPVLNTQR